MTWRWIVRLVALAGTAQAGELKDGDIVFQTSRSPQSVAIQRATGSKYSHMGLLLFRDGKPMVLEAVATVRFTPFEEWTRRGTGGHYVIKRLKKAATALVGDDLERLREAARGFEGKPYDVTFEWSDERIYCSELVWKIYQQAIGVELGALEKVGSFKLDDPLVKKKLQERYKGKVPLDEPAISPGAMFKSAELETVVER